MKKYLILAVILVIFSGIAYFVTRPSANAPESIPEELTATYENSEYGYAVSYPGSLAVREYAGGNTAFGTEDGDAFSEVAEVRLVAVSGNEGESLQEAAARELANLCAADSTTQSFSCTGLDRILPFRTTGDLTGYELFLKGELRTIATDERTAVRKGPYYVFPLQMSATGGRAIVVHAPLSQNADEADAATIREIARSLTVSEPVQSGESVEAYVAANISTLSPMPEVLGGTFYITAIEAADGAGTVSYEDGHVAYTADFTYSFREDGSVSVDTFTVRP